MLLLFLTAAPAMAERQTTRLMIKQGDGEGSVRNVMVISDASVAFLSDENQLNWLYIADIGEMWLLDHDAQVAQKISRTEVQIFADKLASEVAKFKASIATLPEAERMLSMQRFEQLFERSSQRAHAHVDEFRAESRHGEFAGIECQWHEMIKRESTGDRLLGNACLAKTQSLANGEVLASFISDLTGFFDIVKNAETGPIQFPVVGNPVALAAGQGMMAIKVTQNSEFSNLMADMEVISVSIEIGSNSQYQIPDDYHRQCFSETL